MATYKFAVLDPRPAGAAANEAVFAQGPCLGVEVSVAALAERCSLGNIDPQEHCGGGNKASAQAAIEAALGAPMPPEGAVLVTVRADLDAVGAMAVFELRQEDLDALEMPGTLARIAQVGESDRFARGGWPGPRALPTTDKPWPDKEAGQLAAIAHLVTDFKVSIEQRVAAMRRWLESGEEPAERRELVEKERADMVRALEAGAIARRTAADGWVAVVKSTHRAATAVGYSLAPVVVALNPAFRFQGGDPIAKFTVCQFEAGYVDLRSVWADLAELEPGWGGSPTVGGSPQGVSSTMSVEQVLEVVERHLFEVAAHPAGCGLG